MKKTLLLLCLWAFSVQTAAAQGGSFSFPLDHSARTSAGVYNSDGVLVRTLWSGVSYNAGNYTRSWDGKDDAGSTVPPGTHSVKLLSNNVTYTWQGVLGNTSYGQTRANMHVGLQPIHSMAQSGSNLYVACGYSEGRTSTWKTTTTNPQAKTAGNKIKIKSGTNASVGTATLVGGTVTVNTTAVTANSVIILTVQSLGTVTVATPVAVTAKTAGTSFVITSSDNTDTSTIGYWIFDAN